jgi:hypothetical protein
VENDEHRGAEHQQPRHQERDSSYSDFLATHPPVFVVVIDYLGGRQLALHHEFQVWATSLYGVSKDYTQHSNSKAQLEHGGLPTSPPYY